MKFDPEVIKELDYGKEKSFASDLSKAHKFLQLKQSLGENWFFNMYDLDNLLIGDWLLIEFNFSASNIQISNDSNNLLLFSWGDKDNDGNVDMSGLLYPGETLPFNQLERKKIYLRMKGKVRLWAY